MSTRSRIGCTQCDGTIKSVYCHSDGYLDGVGKTLLESYCDPTKIDALIALGDLSSLGSDLLFNTQAYMRDRSETGCEAIESLNVTAFIEVADGSDAEYAYLWADSQWTVWSSSGLCNADANNGLHLTAAVVAEVLES